MKSFVKHNRNCSEKNVARCRWLTPVILATQEAEIRGISVQSQSRQIVHGTLFQKKKKSITKKRTGGVAQGVGPEFKPQYLKIIIIIHIYIILSLLSFIII
jgi:hypothetical protein